MFIGDNDEEYVEGITSALEMTNYPLRVILIYKF